MRVGDRVVCINDKFPFVSLDQQIREGEIYTVRWAGNFTHYIDGSFYGIKLAEIDRRNDDGPEGYGYADMPFRADRFRPVVEPKVQRELEEVV